MNQKSIELLSSEELENVTGGLLEECKDFSKGFIDIVLNCVPTLLNGKLDAKAESIGRATSSVLSLVATVYSTYELAGVLRSKLGKKKVEGEIKEDATTV